MYHISIRYLESSGLVTLIDQFIKRKEGILRGGASP